MNKSKKFTALERAIVALMVVCCAQPATAGNKAQVSPDGKGKVESSITYGTGLSEAKVPPPLGVLSTFSVAIPAAGVNPPAGFPTTGNFATAPLPAATPSTVFCTVTSQNYVGGYKATVRSYVTNGATAGNAELELKIPITPAACASYDADSDIVQSTPTSGELQLRGNGSAGTAIWLRALLYTGPPLPEGETPSRDDLIANGVLKGELVVAGPFIYDPNCPARVPISGDMTKIYLLVDAVALSEKYTMTCQNVAFGCSDSNPQYPAPTITGGCETDAQVTVSYSIAANALPIGVTQVTATAAGADGSILATCTFTATRSGLTFDGFYAPLSTAGTDCNKNFKKSELTSLGQVIPIKFKTLCG
ncbi:MAG TPA: hypothetical protein VFQ43_16545, partial [Nitrososphaera sp.]|nr:hypothetical protein [Nitrososphaera sp.]